MSAPSRKAKRNPRRKAGKAAGKRKPRTLTFRLTIEAQEMVVAYTPNRFADAGHFEFRSPHRPARRILVSETGYLSHVVSMEDVKAAASPKAYARELVIEAMRRRTKAYDDRQLPLF